MPNVQKKLFRKSYYFNLKTSNNAFYFQLNNQANQVDMVLFCKCFFKIGHILGALQGRVNKENIFKVADVISKLFVSNRKPQDDI